MKQLLFGLQRETSDQRIEEFMREEELKQMQEVRDRLARVREELASLYRRRKVRKDVRDDTV